MYAFFQMVLFLLLMTSSVYAGEAELLTLMTEMESDVVALAEQIELAYSAPGRCSSDVLKAQCERQSYDGCISEFPHQSCPGGDVYARPSCGDGVTCGGLFDFTTTSVRIPLTVRGGLDGDGNPRDVVVKDAMCYSLQAERYMVAKFRNDTDRRGGVEGGAANAMFFGSDESAFRILPARQDKKCGFYDNTRRPWYVAATSGPKDVVLLLDSSSKNSDGMELMKVAATRVVQTLTVQDHVAVLALNRGGGIENVVGTFDQFLVQATEENKKKLLEGIDSLREGATGSQGSKIDSLSAVSNAFRTIQQSRRNEFSSFCNSAILYFTDGAVSVSEQADAPASPDAVASEILLGMEEVKKETDVDPFLFLFSVGKDANEDNNQIPAQRVACAVGGIWSKITSQTNLITALTGYYKLFALGLGDESNERFVAWVDPYPFATAGTMGTTVSAPVYDRSTRPHVLLGSVGLDFTLAAMDKALGVDSGNRKTLQRLVQRSTRTCPSLALSECEMQSLRNLASGGEGLCSGQCTDFVGISAQGCESSTSTQAEAVEYPDYFWANDGNRGRTYSERVCCSVGETRRSGNSTLEELQAQQCVLGLTPLQSGDAVRGASQNTATIIGITISGVAVVIMCAVGICICRQPKATVQEVKSDPYREHAIGKSFTTQGAMAAHVEKPLNR